MFDWKNQSIDLLNEVGFIVSDPGPLRAPVRKFKIRRDENLDVLIETEAALDATSAAPNHPSGTLRFSTEEVCIEHPQLGARAILSGVQTLRVSHNGDHLEEIATIHELTTTLLDLSTAAYTIEWLDNMPKRYMWPDSINTVSEKTITTTISDLTITEPENRMSGSNAAARLTIAGHTLYVCAPPLNVESRAGCVVYARAPDAQIRKKVRTALSFAFGLYLVETGHTIYDNQWRIVRAASISAYSLDGRAFDLPMMPLTWLTERNFQYDIGRQKLQRMVERLVSAYDDLDLGNLAWAYWHARTATAHIAPAHFGAAIEALQRGYVKMNPNTIPTTILPRPKWDELLAAITTIIDSAPIPDEVKNTFRGKIRSGTNSVPQRERLSAIAQAL
jgi:hypothetical protein